MNTVTPTTDEEVNGLLAYAIPALSLGAGGAVVDDFEDGFLATNMNTYPGITSNPDWPDERGPFDTSNPRYWLHGDYKDVGYLYVYELYDAMVSRGGL